MSEAAERRPVLHAFVMANATRAFAWGASDCAVFAFDCVQALTGRDPVKDLRGTYSTARGALRVMGSFGGLAGLADKRLGGRVHADLVQDGDVALLSETVCDPGERAGGALGVAYGQYIVAQGERGLVLLPRAQALAWWRAD